MPHSNDTETPSPPKPRSRVPVGVAIALIGVAIFVWTMRCDRATVQYPQTRMQSSNNLKQIGRAMYGYEEVDSQLPPRAICDASGTPLLSWRVAILPFMEEGTLYNQFKLDEPWDSVNNKPLIAQMPHVYLNPKSNGDRKSGLTHYKVFAGRNSVFDEPIFDGETWQNRWSVAGLEKTPRGTSELVLCAEAGEAVIWTKPEDFHYDPEGPLPNLTPIYVGSFMVLKADGSVLSLRKDFKESALRAAIDPNSTSKESLDQ